MRPTSGAARPRLAFPWPQIMGFGLGVLRLPPAAFWAMTLQEIDAAAQGLVGATPTSGPPGRGDLEGLMRLFPDVPPRSGAPAS